MLHEIRRVESLFQGPLCSEAQRVDTARPEPYHRPMNIHERIAALPRARRGDETIILVSETELAEIIGDAQASEAALVTQGPDHDLGGPFGQGDVIQRAADRARRAPQAIQIHTSEPRPFEQIARNWVKDYDAEHGPQPTLGYRSHRL